MGNSSSKVEVNQSNHPARAPIPAPPTPDTTDKELKKTRAEVSELKPLITENVIQKLMSNEDAMVLRYSDLNDATKISEHIQEIFKDEYAIQFLTEAAEKMITVFHKSEEMTKLLRWNQVQKVMKCEDKTVGMELHYKVIITEKKGMLAKVGVGTTDTVVILGYKFIANVLDVDPKKLPDDAKLKGLRF